MFRVKALYDYSSPHDDDLSFPAGQIITVNEEEDADWYIGQYVEEATGAKREGLFPKNFVEKHEPEPPPRPNRISRFKPTEPQVPADVPAPATPAVEEPRKSIEVAAPASPITEAPKAAEREPLKLPQVSKPATQADAKPPPPKPVTRTPSATKPPSPAAEKPSSFRDRIAAFNRPAAAPVAPFKPGSGGGHFIKKPFVAPPPSRNAYIPPAPRETTTQKVYRREEDPEIAQRQAQDQEAAEKAGLAGAPVDEGEDAPKPTSLKERIALLQKQQMEQARRNEASSKEKAKRPARTRTESDNIGENSSELEKFTSVDGSTRASSDLPRAVPPRRASHGPGVPEVPPPTRETFSDGNDADQSAAGETTEDAEGTSTSVEEDDESVPIAIPAPAQPVVEDNRDDQADAQESGDDEEDAMDAEARRKLELRERMAKMSGGMGMPGMFGPPGGLGGAPPKKKKPIVPEPAATEDSQRLPPQRMPLVPVPGMSTMRSPDLDGPELEVQKVEDDDFKPAVAQRAHDEIPDVEDVEPTSPPAERGAAPPLPRQRPTSTSERPVPAIPGDRPTPTSPTVKSPPPGYEAGDEMPDVSKELPVRGVPPPVPTTPRDAPDVPFPGATMSPTDRRSSRIPPPIPLSSLPLSSPPMSPLGQPRPPPPPPPTAAPPSRQNTSDSFAARKANSDDSDEETEYEGDYDTDIASGATHKDALKHHTRDLSLDDSTTTDDRSLKSSHLPPAAPPPVPNPIRAVPPPPPTQQPPSARQSMDAPRVPPPVPPLREAPVDEDDDEYDPYRYSGLNQIPPKPRQGVPPPPPTQPAPPPQPPPIYHSPQDDRNIQESDEDELYTKPPPMPVRRSTDRAPPPLPPQGPPPKIEHHAPPPPPQSPPQVFSPPPIPPYDPASAPPTNRKSLEVNRATANLGRKSMEQPRPSTDQGYIANEVDLDASSFWWTQPNTAPPVFQGRKDILFEVEESTSSKRGGKTTVSKDVYILFQDYSQTVATARYDAQNPGDVVLEQRHEAPPARLRQDQLEDAHSRFGQRIADDVTSKQNAVIGDGTPHGLILELLKPLRNALSPVGIRAYGALVYANLANATVQQHDEIRPGDIITFRNAKFEGKHGAMHQKYKVDLGKEHVGVVMEWDGTKKKVRAYEQGRESKKCKPESFKVGDLRSGEVRVWRIMGRGWVGWDDGK